MIKKKYPVIGWREWISLPDLGIPKLKAKIDTGARTSALHAFDLEPIVIDGKNKIRFKVYPLQHDDSVAKTCEADIVDKRIVTDSGGHREERYVILTPINLASHTWAIEITLAERADMQFRMLLGRSALRRRFIVNPARSFVTTRILIK